LELAVQSSICRQGDAAGGGRLPIGETGRRPRCCLGPGRATNLSTIGVERVGDGHDSSPRSAMIWADGDAARPVNDVSADVRANAVPRRGMVAPVDLRTTIFTGLRNSSGLPEPLVRL